jgi:hypothetical protein
LIPGRSKGFSLWHPSRPAPHWGSLPRGVKQLVHVADPSPPSGVKVQNAWSSASTPICLYGVVINYQG